MKTAKTKDAAERRRKLEDSFRITREEILSMMPENSGASAKLDRLLSLKGQLSVTPTAVHVAMEDVKSEYDFGTFRILRCKGCFVYKTVSLTTVVYPVYNWDVSNGGGCLYAVMDELCTLREKKNGPEGLTDSENNAYEIAVMLVSQAFSYPVMTFTDMELAVDCYRYVMDRWSKALEKASAHIDEISDEDIALNQQFEEMMKLAGNDSGKSDKD